MSKNCWEYNNCDKKDGCPAYPNNGNLCWSVEGTLCGNAVQGEYREKIRACRSGCDYYQGLMQQDIYARVASQAQGSPN